MPVQASYAEEIQNQPNGQLEQTDGEWLNTIATQETVGGDTAMATLG